MTDQERRALRSRAGKHTAPASAAERSGGRGARQWAPAAAHAGQPGAAVRRRPVTGVSGSAVPVGDTLTGETVVDLGCTPTSSLMVKG